MSKQLEDAKIIHQALQNAVDMNPCPLYEEALSAANRTEKFIQLLERPFEAKKHGHTC